jgi:hypothetical protein
MFSLSLEEIDSINEKIAKARGIVQLAALVQGGDMLPTTLPDSMWCIDDLLGEVNTTINRSRAKVES